MRAAILILETFYYVRATNLILDIYSVDLCTSCHFLSFFQPIIDLFLIQFVVRFPIISLFNQETGWVSGLYYFHHIISSLNQVLDSCYNFPPFFII